MRTPRRSSHVGSARTPRSNSVDAADENGSPDGSARWVIAFAAVAAIAWIAFIVLLALFVSTSTASTSILPRPAVVQVVGFAGGRWMVNGHCAGARQVIENGTGTASA
jgi:hypothetical protein